MKPFDLEAAKRGEPIVTRDGRETFFVGICKGDRPIVVCDSAGNLTRLLHDGDYTANGAHMYDLFMAPKKRTVWVNLYEFRQQLGDHWHDTEELADITADEGRIGNKAWPVEIEE